MKRIPIEMSVVKGCEVSKCVYNADSACHAKAITVGDTVRPDCDTYFTLPSAHTKAVQRQAGVGACKMSDCKFNEDFECISPEISMGFLKDAPKCMTYSARS